MFHIGVISYYQLITSSAGYVSGDPMYRIKDVEASRRVWLYKDQNQAEKMSGESVDAPLEEKPLLNTLRKVDIVLESTDASDDDGEIWIELKSYRSSPRDKLKTRVEGLNRWVMSSKNETQKQCRNSSLHKQFVHDRIALQHGVHSTAAANRGLSYEPIDVGGVKWWFQKFKVEVKNTRTRNVVRTDTSVDVGSYSAQGNVRNNLTDLPKGKLDTINLNLFGVEDERERNSEFQNRANISGYDGSHIIDEFSVKSAVLSTMLQSGLLPSNSDIMELIESTMFEP